MAASVSALKVPTIFTAVDKYSSILGGMTKSTASFSSRASAGIARVNRLFSSLTPVFGEAGQQLLDAAKTAAVAGGILAGITFSGQSLLDYQTQLASFRTIVSDLSNKDFKVFQKEIAGVAKESKGLANTVDVAASFEKIAGLNSKFAETAAGLGMVSKATITLSKASGDELGPSAESLVGIMNQYSLGADQANRTINVLAAGQAVGAASITQTAEAFVNFGSVAKSSNISLEQSVGLIQTLGKYSIFGAEAGTKLRGVTLRLQAAGAGYASGQFNINDALAQVSKKYEKLSSQRKKDALLLKIFGAENISVGKTLLSNISVINDYTKGVTGTSEAQKAAAINSDTLTKKVEAIKNMWVNYITTNDQVSGGMDRLKGLSQFVIDNFATLITVGTNLLIVFGSIKTMLLVAQGVMWAYNVVLGINALLTGTFTEALAANTVAMGAATFVAGLATAANWLLAASVAAALSPITLTIAAIGAIIAVFYYWDEIVAWFSKVWEKFTSWLSGTWDSIVAAFTKFSFRDMFIGIGKSIVEFFLFPLKAVLSLAAKIPGAIGKGASAALMKINDISTTIGVVDNTEAKPALASPMMKSEQLRNEREQSGTNILDVNFNDPGGMVKSTSMKGSLQIPIKVTSTQGVK